MEAKISSLIGKLKGADPVVLDVLPAITWFDADKKRSRVKLAIYYDENHKSFRSLITMSREQDVEVQLIQKSYYAEEGFNARLVEPKIVRIATENTNEDGDAQCLVVIVEYSHAVLGENEEEEDLIEF